MADAHVREPTDTRKFGDDTPLPPGAQVLNVGQASVHGEGTFSLPPGMTPEEAERLVRDADAANAAARKD